MSQREYFLSSGKFLYLKIDVDYKSILHEAINLKNRFVPHRSKSYLHNGWQSICLHGVSETHIDTWGEYGFKSAEDAGNASKWTTVSSECPFTMDFLLNKFPSTRYARVRFETVKSKGSINGYSSRIPCIETISVLLNKPAGYSIIWDDGDELECTAGSVIAINNHYPYTVTNNSNEDQYNLVISRHDSTNEWKSLMNQACIAQNITGEYILHDIAS